MAADSPQVQKAQAFGQMLKDDYGDWEAIRRTIATKPVHSLMDASVIFSGGGLALARVPMKTAQVAGRTLSKIGTELNPINMAAKPTISLAKQPINKLADELARRGVLKEAAKSLKVSPKAFSNVQEATGDISAAQKTADMLGPDAMVANLTPELTQDARLLAAMPVKNNSPRQALLKAARDQLDNSGARAAADWERAVGPAKSRFDKTLEIARTKAGTSSLYEIAKGRIIDPRAIIDEVPKLVDAAKNNPQSRAAISELNDMLVDPRTGGFVTDAGELINARQRIDELIKSAGAGQTVTPGADLYEVGRRTTTGGHLARLRRAINDTLHQDPILVQADATFSGAERARSAFELGNKKIIGTGDSVIEPQALEARFAKMKPEEQAALFEGLSRRGKNAIGDVSPNRNEGKAFADAFAKPNNLARLEALGVDSGIVQNMAAREDALASSSNRILGGSDTARTELARDRYPSIDAPVKGGVGGTLLAALSAGGTAAYFGHPLVGMAIAGAGGAAAKIIKALASRGRNITAQDAAKLMSMQGKDLERLLKEIKSLPAKGSLGTDAHKKLLQAITSRSMPFVAGSEISKFNDR